MALTGRIERTIPIRLLKNAYLLRCAASFVTAAYAKVRRIPQDLRALHLSIFEQPVWQGVFQHPAIAPFLVRGDLMSFPIPVDPIDRVSGFMG
jgi:hypothetical protein